MQDAEGAARELERCVNELGFRGALVNGFSQVGDADKVVYYDLPQYRPFWADRRAARCAVLLHPRNPLPRDGKIYEGHAWLLGPIWAFGHETAVHALRLMGQACSMSTRGCNIILGHLGEEPALRHVADRQRQWLDREPAQLSGQETDRGIISAPISISPRPAIFTLRR